MRVEEDAVVSPAALRATPLFLGALASGGAGFIHAAAAGSHTGDRTMSVLFAVAAAVQLGWAAVAIARPGRLVVTAGIVANLGLAAVWLLTRTVGISFVSALSTVDRPGFQDTLAAALAMVAVSTALWSLAADTPPRWMHHSSFATVATVFVVAITVPAMAAGHEHVGSEVADAELGATATTELSAEAVAFVDELDGEAADEEAPDDDAADEDATDEGHAHDDSPITSLYDPRVTPEQREAARRPIDDTTAGMAAFPDLDSVLAAGYISIGDGVTGFEHFVNIANIVDGAELDPNRIVSIVARVNPDGSKDIVSAMYLMSPRSTMADVPDIAGALTKWHDHQNLCWEGIRVVARANADGSCPRGEFRGTSPMLHVWIEPHPCGPFAGLEGHGGGCGHDDH